MLPEDCRMSTRIYWKHRQEFLPKRFEENTAGKEQFYDFRLVSRVGLRLNKTIRETCGVVSASGLQNIGYLFLRRISFRLKGIIKASSWLTKEFCNWDFKEKIVLNSSTVLESPQAILATQLTSTSSVVSDPWSIWLATNKGPLPLKSIWLYQFNSQDCKSERKIDIMV